MMGSWLHRGAVSVELRENWAFAKLSEPQRVSLKEKDGGTVRLELDILRAYP